MDVLVFLIEHRGELVTREQIGKGSGVGRFTSIPTTASMQPFERSGRF